MSETNMTIEDNGKGEAVITGAFRPNAMPCAIVSNGIRYVPADQPQKGVDDDLREILEAWEAMEIDDEEAEVRLRRLFRDQPPEGETNVERLQDGLLTILTAAVKRARRGDPRSDVDVAEFVMQNWPNTTRLLTTGRDQPPEGAVRGHTKVTLITDGQHYISPGYDGEGREGRTYWYVEALILGATDELDRENARAAHHAWTENAALRDQPPEGAVRAYLMSSAPRDDGRFVSAWVSDKPIPAETYHVADIISATDRGENDG